MKTQQNSSNLCWMVLDIQCIHPAFEKPSVWAFFAVANRRWRWRSEKKIPSNHFIHWAGHFFWLHCWKFSMDLHGLVSGGVGSPMKGTIPDACGPRCDISKTSLRWEDGRSENFATRFAAWNSRTEATEQCVCSVPKSLFGWCGGLY